MKTSSDKSVTIQIVKCFAGRNLNIKTPLDQFGSCSPLYFNGKNRTKTMQIEGMKQTTTVQAENKTMQMSGSTHIKYKKK